MKKRNKICAIILAGIMVLTAAACGTAESELPDLSGMGEITVVAREDGSGTRSEFESIVDTDEDGANQAAFSTEEVLELVENDVNAIGYLAFSALDEVDTGNVTVLTVNEVSCTADTIADGSYPLEREYILAYSGQLSDLETDFITYVRGAGQEIVSQTCTPVRDTSKFLSGGYSGTITIRGSSSMETLMTQLIEGYAQYNSNAVIELVVSDSTDGLNAAMQGECDLAMSSRSLANYEQELLGSYVIAADGIAVIVNSQNPLTDISLSRLKTIYDGDVTAWSALE